MSQENNSSISSKYLVVVGASAGGIQALTVLLKTLDKNFPAPVVIAQHLDPNRASHLGAVFERHSKLPVITIEGMTRLEPGKVYVTPSNRHVSIQDGFVTLEGDHENRPRPSVDLLLSSASKSYRENLIAVILTGSGSDGAAGAIDVKNAGGTVIIQNPETARYPSMPLALPPMIVDHVVNLENIGSVLYDLINGLDLAMPSPVTDPGMHNILEQISQHTNIDFHAYKPTTIYRRIKRRMVATRTRDLEDYAQYLSMHPEELAEMVMSLLIKVTEFFRDPEAFSYLKKEILPELIEVGRERGRVIRLWSAGCATGEEPYSLAFLLSDLLGPELTEWTIKIFATDLDEAAISFARRGVYPEKMLRNLPDDYRSRFFEPVDQSYGVLKPIRQMVIFGQQDLSRGVPFPRIDMVVCRNLLIYFKPELQQDMLNLFAYSLRHMRGYLFLGKAETARPSNSYYELVNKKWKVYRCTSGPFTAGGRTARNTTALEAYQGEAAEPGRILRGDKQRHDLEQSLPEIELRQLRRFNDMMMRFVPFGVVIIDRNYRILTTNTAARRLFGIRDVAAGIDFLHSVHGLPYTEVREAIDEVFRAHTTITLPELEIRNLGGTEARYLSITIATMQIEGGMPGLILLSATDATETVQTRQRLEALQAEQQQLLDELTQTNKRLNEINKELQDTNEELQSANEELMLAEEELQATNEEFESTNEELQATNEELETNNEELQATNEELETTNEELTQRTQDLQEAMDRIANERVRLMEMVELAPFHILVLGGPALIVEAFNHRFSALLGGQEILGRSFDEVAVESSMPELAQLARDSFRHDVIKTASRVPVRIPGEGAESDALKDSYFDYTIVPTHENMGKVDGVVIYADDVTEKMNREFEESREKLKLMVENAGQVALALYDARTTELLQASPRYLDILARAHTYPRGELIGGKWKDLDFITANKKEAAELFDSVIAGRVSRRMSSVRARLPNENRETVWDLSLTPIPFTEEGQSDAVHYLVVSAVEITDEVRAREELERAHKIKDEFLSLASHELRTPLVPLMGYAGLLVKIASEKEKEPGWDKRITEYSSKFHKQLKHLNRLIDDLFDVTRLQNDKLTLERKRVDMASITRQAAEEAMMLSSRHEINVEVQDDGGPIYVIGDESRLAQILLNLLENGIKYAPKSKRIDVRLTRVPGDDQTSGLPGAKARIEIQDYGPGILKEEIKSIFIPFYQSSQRPRMSRGGLGLGLYICQKLVEQHGGIINIDSVVGEGSTFTILLPLAGEQEQ